MSYRPDHPVDCVYFSSLTMIPDWRGAIDNALAMLKPGGKLGVVDLYLSDPRPEAGLMPHSAFDRNFWPRWFAHNGVRLNPEHLFTPVARLVARLRPDRTTRSCALLAGSEGALVPVSGPFAGYARLENASRVLSTGTSMPIIRSIFLCDVHLGTRARQAECLLDFLREYDSEHLFLVGDIVDFWAMKSTVVC